MLDTQAHVEVITPLPSNLDIAHLIALFQAHTPTIDAQPFITDRQVLTDPSDRLVKELLPEWSKYEDPPHYSNAAKVGAAANRLGIEHTTAQITTYKLYERVPWYGEISFGASYRNCPAGFDVVVHAPMGVKFRDHFGVVDGGSNPWMEGAEPKGPRGEQGSSGWFLREEALMTTSAMLMWFVKWNFVKAHRELHEKMINEVVMKKHRSEVEGWAQSKGA